MIDQAATRDKYQLQHNPIKKTRVLIVSDSRDHLTGLRASFNTGEVEITSVSSPQELNRACRVEHDLAIIDVRPAHIRGVLKSLRASTGHAEISVLVEASRIIAEREIAGVLPMYRAMPCSHSELLLLVRGLINPVERRWNERKLL
jgi:DNA-binding NtrC family response regulator